MSGHRIIFVTDYCAPYVGGMEIHAEECARYFQKNGELAGVCLMSLPDTEASLSHFLKSTSLQQTSTTRLSQSSINTVDELARALATYGAGHGTTIFFNSLYWVRILGEVRRLFPEVTMFIRSGGNDLFQARIEGAGATLAERQSYLVRQISSYADGLIVNSVFSRNRFSKLGIPKEMMSIVLGGVDTARFTPANQKEKDTLRENLGLPRDKVIVIAACRLVKFKGISQTLDVLRQVQTETPFLYVIIGDGPERAALERHVHDIGAPALVRFVDTVSHRNIPDYFRAADVFCYFPRLEIMQEPGGTYVHTETMGRSFCEAMASGLPVISSRVGGIGEVVRSGTHGILTAEDLHERTAALTQMIENEPLRKKLGVQARQYAERQYAWENVCSHYRELFSL